MALRIAIVEDHQAVREGLAMVLEGRGCEVVGRAGSAREALWMIERTHPDVAVVDVGLRDEDGIWLTRRITDEEPHRHVLLYTGSGDDDLVLGGLDAGAGGFALKEGTTDELLEAVHAVAHGGTYVDPRLRTESLARRMADRRAALSPREREIIDLLAQGMTGEQVAEHLVLSSETVKTHVRNAMHKLDAATRTHAIAIALREGYIAPPERSASQVTRRPSGVGSRTSLARRPTGV